MDELRKRRRRRSRRRGHCVGTVTSRKGRDSHEAILAKFPAHESDVLIGTQMIAKRAGHPAGDAGGRGLGGHRSATAGLPVPHIPAAGAGGGAPGRGPKGGRVIIQTYSRTTLRSRRRPRTATTRCTGTRWNSGRRLGYPPFGRLVAYDLLAHRGGLLAGAGGVDGAPAAEEASGDGSGKP